MAHIQIIVGSVMGTALGVAKSAGMILEGCGHHITLHEVFDKKRFDHKATLLFCTSSTGMGDLPESIVPFFRYVLAENPPLYESQYGLISLGDSSYTDYAQAGKTIDELLQDRGAKRIGETLIMDAILVDDHEEEAADWIAGWENLVAQRNAPTS